VNRLGIAAILLVIRLAWPGAPCQAANTFSGLHLSPDSPAALLLADTLVVAFAYTADPPQGVDITLTAMTGNDPTPNQVVLGSTAYPAGPGNGVFALTMTGSPANIDGLRLRMSPSGAGTLVAETVFPVTLHYGAVARITEIHLTPESPASLFYGDSVRVEFRYTSAAGVWAFVYPFTGGRATPYASAREVRLSGSGTAPASFKVDSGTGTVTVDHLRIEVDDEFNASLLAFVFPVTFRFASPVATIPARWGQMKSKAWRGVHP
jgi:hypothetical protein